VRLDFFGEQVEAIREFDTASGKTDASPESVVVSPAKHFVMPDSKIEPAIERILAELADRVKWFEGQGQFLEAQRLQSRTRYDVEMLREIGYCAGIENYSRHLSGRAEGEPPATLLDYFPGPFLTIIDESHVTIPQLRGMYHGDQSRKSVLVEHGFRLPSAKDNRPLNFEEFLKRVGPIVFTTATPGPFEAQVAGEPVRQVIRPTGLVDPPVEIRPLEHQIDDLTEEIRLHAERGDRVLVTTLTKRTAEDLAQYLRESRLRVEYLHADIDAIERVEILNRLRRGTFDCLVGINLLREGLDLPEVALVAILDADKEGFLRSETSLIQVAGRTARHVKGKVILYADHVTDSMKGMIRVTEDRRRRQMEYNREHGITPRSVQKSIRDGLILRAESEGIEERVVRESGVEYDAHHALQEVEKEMLEAAEALEFERAAVLRDEMLELKRQMDGGERWAGKESGPRRHVKTRRYPGGGLPRTGSRPARPGRPAGPRDRRVSTTEAEKKKGESTC
jgi:excinuclease ABC subunit B